MKSKEAEGREAILNELFRIEKELSTERLKCMLISACVYIRAEGEQRKPED